MLSAIWALLKAAATGLIWAKESSDQNTGRKLSEGESAKANVEVKDAQLQASVDRPHNRDELIDRLRSHRDAD